MANKNFYSVAELEKEVKKRINAALREEVGDYVEDKLKEHIQSDVYNTYTPVSYERRTTSGGLLDDSNIRRTVTNNTLSVYEEAEIDGPRLSGEKFPNKDGLAQLIEHGAYNPWDKKRYRWMKPRKFVTNTQKEINSKYSQILKLLKNRIENNK